MATIRISTDDNFQMTAYEARPEGPCRGAVVVVQEIFGVNSHIRAVADGYAAAGFYALAPALFDRAESGIELGYEQDDMTRGVDLAFNQLQMPRTLGDLAAAVDHAASFGKVGMVGYCFGGLLTWLSACQNPALSAASAYYGGGVPGMAEMSPQCPIILHFGEQDAHIPMDSVKDFMARHPELAVYIYDADHGFNCEQRASFDEQAAALAKQRTLAFFAEHLDK